MSIKIPSDLSRRDLTQWIRRGVIMYGPERIKLGIGGEPITVEEDEDGAALFMVNSRSLIRINDSALYEWGPWDREYSIDDVRSDGWCFWPEVGYYNVPMLDRGEEVWTVAEVGRRAHKQYTRTMTEPSLLVRLIDPWRTSHLKQANGTTLTSLSASLVAQYGLSEFPTFSEATEMLNNGTAMHVALSRHVCTDGNTVLYRGVPVGEWSQGEIAWNDSPTANRARKLLGEVSW